MLLKKPNMETWAQPAAAAGLGQPEHQNTRSRAHQALLDSGLFILVEDREDEVRRHPIITVIIQLGVESLFQ